MSLVSLTESMLSPQSLYSMNILLSINTQKNQCQIDRSASIGRVKTEEINLLVPDDQADKGCVKHDDRHRLYENPAHRLPSEGF